eukprot:11041517-Lingulodinium_polyedra.AAC.1
MAVRRVTSGPLATVAAQYAALARAGVGGRRLTPAKRGGSATCMSCCAVSGLPKIVPAVAARPTCRSPISDSSARAGHKRMS